MTPERWRQVLEVFDAAVLREESGRGSYVAAVCAQDEELARAVHSLLLAHCRATGFAAAPIMSATSALAAGDVFGPYRIDSLLGRGGMGEVYKARDTRLKRDVALKVLPEAFAGDPGRLARFQREAEVLASLNHPNIAQIYGVEGLALVMELVDGESPKGPMSFGDAWKIASQMADALEFAHERGIVHRDIKPSNLKVTPDGTVKLLDFGLGKAFGEAATDSPHVSSGTTTVPGTIMGTIAYMAPEQALGKRVDKRADIWSWAVVLYELLAGESPFTGDNATDTLEKVLTKEPELARVPTHVRRLLHSCLEKDTKKRLRDIGDAWRLLEQTPPRTAAPLLRLHVELPDNADSLHSVAISPDGRVVAVAAEVNGKRQLWLRALDVLQAHPLSSTDDAAYPFWSPDSRHIAFFAQGKLRRISASGGPAQSLCDAPDGRGGSWSRDDVIVFAPNGSGAAAIQSVSAVGGVPAAATKDRGNYRYPVFLPSGRHFLYVTTQTSPESNGVYISSLDGRENRRILPDESSVVVVPGRLLFVREGSLLAQPFDAVNGRTLGPPSPIAGGVALTTNFNYAPVAASETGVLVYRSVSVTGTNQLVLSNRAGKLLALVSRPGRVFEPSFSPDGKRVLFRRASASARDFWGDLWLWDLAQSVERRLTTHALALSPTWAPTGDRIAYCSPGRGGICNLYQRRAGRTGQDELLVDNGNNKIKIPTQWSRDGRFIVYSELARKIELWVLPMKGRAERKPAHFLSSEFAVLFGQLSPDSRWMAYTSDESGQREVYVRSFPAGEDQTKVSRAGGQQTRWRGDGKELFFLAPDGRMMAAAIKSSSGPRRSFVAEAPRPLFEAKLARTPSDLAYEYDVTADGKRFLLDTVVDSSVPTPPLTIVLNWDKDLKT